VMAEERHDAHLTLQVSYVDTRPKVSRTKLFVSDLTRLDSSLVKVTGPN